MPLLVHRTFVLLHCPAREDAVLAGAGEMLIAPCQRDSLYSNRLFDPKGRSSQLSLQVTLNAKAQEANSPLG